MSREQSVHHDIAEQARLTLPIVDIPGRSHPSGWMHALAEHFATVRGSYPTEELCVVFDIDGTILDLRYLVVHVLLSYDRDHGTELFHGLVPDDVTVSENDDVALLESLAVSEPLRGEVGESSTAGTCGTRRGCSQPALPTGACSA